MMSPPAKFHPHHTTSATVHTNCKPTTRKHMYFKVLLYKPNIQILDLYKSKDSTQETNNVYSLHVFYKSCPGKKSGQGTAISTSIISSQVLGARPNQCRESRCCTAVATVPGPWLRHNSLNAPRFRIWTSIAWHPYTGIDN